MCKPQLFLGSFLWTYLLSLDGHPEGPSSFSWADGQELCQGQGRFLYEQTLQSKVTESALILTHVLTAVSGTVVLYLGIVLGGCFWGLLRLGCEGQGFPRQPGRSFLAPQEPEAQAAQVSDVPTTSRRPEQVSRAVVGRGRCPGPLAVYWA